MDGEGVVVPRVGFMQGRLSPLVDGKIQAFPWRHWREEFATANRHGFEIMEWTIDQERLNENPLVTASGRAEIRRLSDEHDIRVESLTGDCFMQAPFYKSEGARRTALLADFRAVLDGCLEIGVRHVVVPLVDNGRIEDRRQVDVLHAGLDSLRSMLRDGRARIVFESDFDPPALAQFIADFFPTSSVSTTTSATAPR